MAEIRRYRAEQLPLGRCLLGESPFFDPRTGILSYVDITAGQFFRILPSGEKRVFRAGQMIGSALPARQAGSYLLCASDGLYLFKDEQMHLCLDLKGVFAPWQRCNDAKPDPEGRLFFGSSSMDESAGFGGDLFIFGRELKKAEPDTGIANGMAFNRAMDRFYFADSAARSVFVYDYDPKEGTIRNRRTLFQTEGGVPDGLCIDGEDHLWTAVWGGKRIEQRDGRSGELLGLIELDASHVTSCCFMREHTLLITSSGEGLAGYGDGALFCCDVDAAMAPVFQLKAW